MNEISVYPQKRQVLIENDSIALAFSESKSLTNAFGHHWLAW